MQSVSSARFVTLPLTRRKQEALKQLLEQFAASVNFCIKKVPRARGDLPRLAS